MSNCQTVKTPTESKLARMFAALGNPNRLQIYTRLLAEGRTDVARGRVYSCLLSKLREGSAVTAPTMSHHVKELVDSGLVRAERVGKQLSLVLEPEPLAQLRHLFGNAKQAK
jgi:ArsR family transcriptional regulator, arsenate/arsenite/antimonite-responsive transcriptional repressor